MLQGSAGAYYGDCIIATYIDSCVSRLGNQQDVACSGCSYNQTSGNHDCLNKAYKDVNEGLTAQSWAKNRAVGIVHNQEEGYATATEATADCGESGVCQDTCAEIVQGSTTMYKCVIFAGADHEINYWNLSGDCGP